MLEIKDDCPLLWNDTQYINIGEMEDSSRSIYYPLEYETTIAVPTKGSAF